MLYYNPWENNIIYVTRLYGQPVETREWKTQWERRINKDNFWSWTWSSCWCLFWCQDLSRIGPLNGFAKCRVHTMCSKPWNADRFPPTMKARKICYSAVILRLIQTSNNLLSYANNKVVGWNNSILIWLVLEGLDLNSDQLSRVLRTIWLLGSY